MTYYIYRLVNQPYNNVNRKIHYIGSTPNPYRRIKQHNGILSGGAKYTTTKPASWHFNWLLMTFLDKNMALSIEFHMKHPFSLTLPIKGKYTTYNVEFRSNIYKYRMRRFSDNINEQLMQIDITLAYVSNLKQTNLGQILLLIDDSVRANVIYRPSNYKLFYLMDFTRSLEEDNFTSYFDLL
jgi:predicted GIY-YIG superfamily endonuclease